MRKRGGGEEGRRGGGKEGRRGGGEEGRQEEGLTIRLRYLQVPLMPLCRQAGMHAFIYSVL